MSLWDEGYVLYGDVMNGDAIQWYPPRGKLLVFMRKDWQKPWVGRTDDLNPMMNTAGLYWKLTGIAKESE